MRATSVVGCGPLVNVDAGRPSTGVAVHVASVVIPAHNEQHAIPRLLDSLLEQELNGIRLEVVVVVNGSTDESAGVACAYVDRFAACGHQLTVVETSTASKACALNEGDRNVTSFPRLYLDADISLSLNAIRRTVEQLTTVSTPMLAAPRVQVACSSALAVRHYARIWSQLPYIRTQVPGVGFYAVNQAGRRRWWRFPTRIGADDKFVRLHFCNDEAVLIDDASFTIFLPERLGELLRVRSRWVSFNREIVRHCPGLDRRDKSRWRSSVRYIAHNASAWPYVPTFLAVWLASWALSLLRPQGKERSWSRATSSPMRAPPTAHLPASVAVGARTRRPVEMPVPKRSVHAAVVTYNSTATATRCIERLLESEGIDELRITVVDNASDDGVAEALATRFSDIEVISNDVNVGFAAAANQAIKHTTSRWVAIVNPDVEVRPDTIAASIAYLERYPEVGCCGVPAVHADGTVNDRSFFMRPSVWSEVTLALGAHRIARASKLLNPEQHVAYRPSMAPVEVDAVAGCFTVLDRELFEHLGGYDEEYFLCGEDLDLGGRAVEAGAAPAVVPVQPIVHRSEASFATRADARIAYLRGRARYQRRWWSSHRAAVAGAIRSLAVLARLAALWLLRSERAGEFVKLWACRGEWTAPVSLRRRRYQGHRRA